MNLLADIAQAVERRQGQLHRTRRDEVRRKERLLRQVEEGAPWVAVIVSMLPATVHVVAERCSINRTNAYKKLAALRHHGKAVFTGREWRIGNGTEEHK